MRVLILGASRNIGLLAALRLLAQGNTVTLFVRSQEAFKDNQDIQKFIASGTARVVVGDALKEADIRRVLTASSYDLIISSLGGSPVFQLSLAITIEPPNICRDSIRLVLAVMRTMSEEVRSTKFIAVSSSGLGRKGYNALPLVLKPLYGYVLQVPGGDKLAMERLIGSAAGQPSWGEDSPRDASEVTEQPWLNAVIVRAAVLTDGECQGDDSKMHESGKQPYRVGELLPSAYSISRKDIAHFIVEDVIPHFDKYNRRAVDVAY